MSSRRRKLDVESDGERISSGSDDESLTSACSDSVTTLATSTDGPPSVASITVDRRNTNRDSNGSISFNGGGGRGSRTRGGRGQGRRGGRDPRGPPAQEIDSTNGRETLPNSRPTEASADFWVHDKYEGHTSDNHRRRPGSNGSSGGNKSSGGGANKDRSAQKTMNTKATSLARTASNHKSLNNATMNSNTAEGVIPAGSGHKNSRKESITGGKRTPSNSIASSSERPVDPGVAGAAISADGGKQQRNNRDRKPRTKVRETSRVQIPQTQTRGHPSVPSTSGSEAVFEKDTEAVEAEGSGSKPNLVRKTVSIPSFITKTLVTRAKDISTESTAAQALGKSRGQSAVGGGSRKENALTDASKDIMLQWVKVSTAGGEEHSKAEFHPTVVQLQATAECYTPSTPNKQQPSSSSEDTSSTGGPGDQETPNGANSFEKSASSNSLSAVMSPWSKEYIPGQSTDAGPAAGQSTGTPTPAGQASGTASGGVNGSGGSDSSTGTGAVLDKALTEGHTHTQLYRGDHHQGHQHHNEHRYGNEQQYNNHQYHSHHQHNQHNGFPLSHNYNQHQHSHHDNYYYSGEQTWRQEPNQHQPVAYPVPNYIQHPSQYTVPPVPVDESNATSPTIEHYTPLLPSPQHHPLHSQL